MHIEYMKQALKEAKKAFDKKEIPVGCIIVKDEKIIARAHNVRENKKNVLCHAEILAIEKACKKLKSWRLDGCEIYVTLEPCPMCAGAIIQSRFDALYYGASDLKTGAGGSVLNLFEYKFNHQVNVIKGILENESSMLLKEFFKVIREKNKNLSVEKE